MVDRPGDILPMDPSKPPVLSTFTRADMALRRMPGLGIILAIFLGSDLWEHRNWLAFGWLVIAVVGVLFAEFGPKLISARALGKPSPPSVSRPPA